MPAIEMTEPRFDCPTSGQMLRGFIHALQLGQGDAESPTAALVGSDEGQRSERRYFAGEDPTTEDVRQRAAARIASALLCTGIVPEFRLPPKSGVRSCRDALAEAFTNWAHTWDDVYRQSSTGWPYLPRSLTGFVIGREIVFDLVLRCAALIHLLDVNPSALSPLALAVGDDAAPSILREAMKMGGMKTDFRTVARAARVEERNAQRWLNESLVPDDGSLQKLAQGIAKENETLRHAILRFLRIQYGFVRLVQTLNACVGARWQQDLSVTFVRLLMCACEVNQRVRADPSAFSSTAEELDLAQMELLRLGTSSAVAPAVFQLWLHEIHGSLPGIWAYELHLASSMNLQHRLERCYQTIGDWPQFWRNGVEANNLLGLSAEDYQTRCESTALVLLCPPLREAVEAEPPRFPDVGIPRELEQKIHRAAALMQEGLPHESVSLWREVLTQQPENADFHVYHGVALRESGNLSGAREAFHRAALLAPNSARPHIETARTYLMQGLSDSALHHLEQLPPEVRDASAELLWVLSELQFREGRLQEALASADKALVLDPDNADAHDLAARILLRMPHSREVRERAARHAKKAAASGRATGLNEWLATKRQRRS